MFLAAIFLMQSAPYVTTVPTDTDLKSMYCIGLLQAQRPRYEATQGGNIFVESVYATTRGNIDKALDRLRSYAVPKIKYLDVDAVEAAYHQGKRSADQKNVDMTECIEAKFLPF